MIKVSNLNKQYGFKNNKFNVINNTSFTLDSTGLVCLVGDSGSGKTTLLNVISGIDKASGIISYDGVEFSKYDANKIDEFRLEKIGYVFQNYYLLPGRTVYDNLKLVLNFMKIIDEKEINKRISYALGLVGMEQYKYRNVEMLSGGQQQRVAIARALVKNADILVCDEPTGNLDSKNSIEVMNVLKAISKERLVLLVTHDKDMAYYYATRIIEIKDGCIIKDEPNLLEGKDLSFTDGNIYLKDYQEEKLNVENLQFDIYKHHEFTINLDILYEDGKYYLNVKNQNLEVLNHNSEVKIIDDSVQNIDFFKEKELHFETFSNIKKSNFINSIKSSFSQSFKSFFQVRNRQKFLYISFIALGFVLALFVFMTASFYKEYSNEIGNYGNAIAVKNSDMDSLNSVDVANYHITTSANVSISKTFLQSTNGYDSNWEKFFFNRDEGIANFYDCYISKSYADSFISKYRAYYKSTNDLVGEKVKVLINSNEYELNIIGINNSSYNLLTVSKDFYNLMTFSARAITSFDINDYEANVNYLPEDFDASKHIVEKIENFSFGNEYCLVEVNSPYKIGEYIETSFGRLLVTGIHNYPNLGIINTTQPIYIEGSNAMSNYLVLPYINKEDVRLIEGRLPQNANEILIFKNKLYVNLELNKAYEINGKKYLIVGIIDDYTKNKSPFLLVNDGNFYRETPINYFGTYIDDDYYYIVDFVNQEQALKVLNSQGVRTYQVKDLIFNDFIVSNIVLILAIIFIILFFAIYTLLIMRSKMLSKIYTIGVYRSLGAKKNVIYQDFITDIIITTTLTSILGYLIASYLFNILASIFPLFIVNFTTVITGCILIYIFNLLFGLLPIYTLLRKTPAEILSKYDI